MSPKSEDMIKIIGLNPVNKKIDYEVLENIQCNGYKRNRMKNNVGIEMASIIPNFMKYYDIDDVVCETVK